MRQVLVDRARARFRLKRGSGQAAEPLDDAPAGESSPEFLIDLDRASAAWPSAIRSSSASSSAATSAASARPRPRRPSGSRCAPLSGPGCGRAPGCAPGSRRDPRMVARACLSATTGRGSTPSSRRPSTGRRRSARPSWIGRAATTGSSASASAELLELAADTDTRLREGGALAGSRSSKTWRPSSGETPQAPLASRKSLGRFVVRGSPRRGGHGTRLSGPRSVPGPRGGDQGGGPRLPGRRGAACGASSERPGCSRP